MTQILVKVRNITKDDNGRPSPDYGNETIETYSAFRHLTEKFELIYQVKESGKDPNTGEILYAEVPGNPNLPTEYQTIVKPSVEVVADTRTEQVELPSQEIKERKKPGPKPKVPTELEEHTA